MTIYYITLHDRDSTPQEPVGMRLFPKIETAVGALDAMSRMQPDIDYRLKAVTASLGKLPELFTSGYGCRQFGGDKVQRASWPRRYVVTRTRPRVPLRKRELSARKERTP